LAKALNFFENTSFTIGTYVASEVGFDVSSRANGAAGDTFCNRFKGMTL